MSVAPEDVTDEKSFSTFRPGHADYAGSVKYNQTDLRNILERSSARKTAIEVAVGAIAKLVLKQLDIECGSEITQIGSSCCCNEFPAEIDLTKRKRRYSGWKICSCIQKFTCGIRFSCSLGQGN